MTGGLDFDGVDDHLDATGVTTANGSEDTTIFVAKTRTTAVQVAFVDNITPSEDAHAILTRPVIPTNFGAFFGDVTTSLDYGSINTNNSLHFIHHSSISSNSSGSLNGSNTALDAGTGGYTGGVRIGLVRDGSLPLDGTFSELIIYKSDQTANESGIEANINSFYGLF